MSEIPDELVGRGAYALHQACIDRWALTGRQGDAGMTKHGPEAHIGSARAVLEAVLPDYHRKVTEEIAAEIERRYESVYDHDRPLTGYGYARIAREIGDKQ